MLYDNKCDKNRQEIDMVIMKIMRCIYKIKQMLYDNKCDKNLQETDTDRRR